MALAKRLDAANDVVSIACGFASRLAVISLNDWSEPISSGGSVGGSC